jgi:hypothetical protein
MAVRAITAGADGSPETASYAASPATAVTPGAADRGDAGAAETASPAATAPAATAGPRTARDRALAEDAAPDVDPALAYGPDDPAYGPPGPDWYQRAERAEDGDARKAESETHATRGPFEPLHHDAADYRPGDGEPDADDYADARPDQSGYEAPDYEVPETLDWGTPSDPEAGVIGHLRDLYQTADTISQGSFETNFDQLLERQRQLISDFFLESGGVGFVEPALPAAPEPPAVASASPPDPLTTTVPLGFDSAESLSSLRGELRGT